MMDRWRRRAAEGKAAKEAANANAGTGTGDTEPPKTEDGTEDPPKNPEGQTDGEGEKGESEEKPHLAPGSEGEGECWCKPEELIDGEESVWVHNIDGTPEGEAADLNAEPEGE